MAREVFHLASLILIACLDRQRLSMPWFNFSILNLSLIDRFFQLASRDTYMFTTIQRGKMDTLRFFIEFKSGDYHIALQDGEEGEVLWFYG